MQKRRDLLLEIIKLIQLKSVICECCNTNYAAYSIQRMKDDKTIF